MRAPRLGGPGGPGGAGAPAYRELGKESGAGAARAGLERVRAGLERVRAAPLPELRLGAVYDVRRVLAEGRYSRVLLAHHRAADRTVVLKAVRRDAILAEDFFREFHYSYHLSPHPNVLDTYDVSFASEGCLVFAQEHAPYGDLASHVRPGGLGEAPCKLLARQLADALDFMHSRRLAHRDVEPENVLVFAPDFSRVKLGDFGSTRKEGAMVTKPACTRQSSLPPEACEAVSNERYACGLAGDAWQLGVALFVCLAGSPPWRAADPIGDAECSAFRRYQRRRTTKIPPAFRKFTPRALRMFRRLFEHEPEKRAPVTEVLKYTKDDWIEAGLRTSSSCSQIADRKESLPLSQRSPGGSRGSRGSGPPRLGLLGPVTPATPSAPSSRVWDWLQACDVNADKVEGI